MSEQSATTTAPAPIEYATHLTISCGVSDLERSIEWYRSLFGFELIYKLDDMGWCELQTPWSGISIGLGQNEEPKPGGTTPVFRVKDTEAARSDLAPNRYR